MATVVGNEAFVEQLIAEVVQPASERLMEGRYFSALRDGTLTMRQIQGYALQHTWFNRQLLQGGGRADAAGDRLHGVRGRSRGHRPPSTTIPTCARSSG